MLTKNDQINKINENYDLFEHKNKIRIELIWQNLKIWKKKLTKKILTEQNK